MFDIHIHEDAELYALGALDELEQARVERHAGVCDACAKRLGEAEATVLQLIEGGEMTDRAPKLDHHVRSVPPNTHAPAWVAAIAAAFLIGLLPWVITSLRQRAAVESVHQQQLAMRAMLAGHFVDTPFVSRRPGAPAAKVVYAREGGWLYIIVAPGSSLLDVVVVARGRAAKVASLPASTAVRSAFVNQPTRVEMVELRDRGVPVAIAQIVYVSPKKR